MTEPLNLDEIAATVVEPFAFVFGGQDFQFPSDPDVVVWELLAANQLQSFLAVLLGDEDYKRMDEIPTATASMTKERLTALIEGYQRHLGFEAPKSSGLNRSYRRTVQR